MTDLKAEMGLSQTRGPGQVQGQPGGIDELIWNMWEASARPGVAHRMRLEEREGTIEGGEGSCVTFVENVGEDMNQLVSVRRPSERSGG